MTLKSQYNVDGNIQPQSQDAWVLLTSSVTLRRLLSGQNLGVLISEMENVAAGLQNRPPISHAS